MSAPPALRTLRSVADLEAIAERWSRLPHRSADSSLELFRATVESRDDIDRPHVVLAEQGDEVTGALVGRIERRKIGLDVAFVTALGVRATSLTVVQEGVLGEPQDVLVAHALGALTDGTAAVVQFLGVTVGSALEATITSGVAPRSVELGPATPNHRATVDVPFDAFVKARPSRARENIRRTARKFDAAGERMTITSHGAGDDAAAVLALLEHISSRSYQRGMGVGFESDLLHEGLVRRGLAEGWFRAWVAHLDGSPCAYWTAFTIGDEWTLHETAFDADAGEFTPGMGLLGRVIAQACAEPGVRTVSFGNGDARYKQEWCDETWVTHTVSVYANSVKWTVVNGSRRTLAKAITVTRERLGEERITKLKTLVRRRAARSARRQAERSDTAGA